MEHKFDVHLAQKHSVEKSILIGHILFHQQANAGLDQCTHENKVWAFIKKETIETMYPYLNYKSVLRWLKELEKQGVILSCKPKAKSGNHLKWYHYPISQNENSKISQNENSSYITNTSINTNSKECSVILEAWNRLYETNLLLTDSKRKQINARLKLFTCDLLIKIITFRSEDSWLKTDGLKYRSKWSSFWASDEKIDNWKQRMLDANKPDYKKNIRGGIV